MAKSQTSEKLTLSSQQEQNISRLRKEMGMEEEEKIRKKRKKKGGPNPLSCKKKKKKTVSITDISKGGVEKKKRRKKKTKLHLPAHLKGALVKTAQREPS